MTASLQIPAYAVGTIQIGAQSGGLWPVIGTGTTWVSPDGTPYWPICAGETLICNGGFGIVGTVTDSTHLSLCYWSGSTVAAGASYTIFRFVPTNNNALTGLLQNLLALFSPPNFGAAYDAWVATLPTSDPHAVGAKYVSGEAILISQG